MIFATRFNLKRASAALLAIGLLTQAAEAQEDAEAAVRETHQKYIEAWTAGDPDALVALFTEDAIYWPATGGRYSGQAEIRAHLEQAPVPTAAQISSEHVERLEGDLILDIGSFSASLPAEAGGEISGEYVVHAMETDDGLRIRRLIGFPKRELPATAQ